MPLVRILARVHSAHGRLCAFGLLLVLLVRLPLAESGPPDPLWIVGIYDAADADDAVVLATSIESLVESAPLLVRTPWMLPRHPCRGPGTALNSRTKKDPIRRTTRSVIAVCALGLARGYGVDATA